MCLENSLVFEYLKKLYGLDIFWQHIIGDLNVHASIVTFPWSNQINMHKNKRS